MKSIITCNTRRGADIDIRDITAIIDDINYTMMARADMDAGEMTITIGGASGDITGSATIAIDAADYFTPYIIGSAWDPEEAAAIQSVTTFDDAPIRAAARDYQINRAAALHIKLDIAADMDHAAIAAAIAAAITARREKSAARAEKTAARADKAIKSGAVREQLSPIGAKWFKLVADPMIQRVCLTFDGMPSADIRNAVKAAGFAWNAQAKEWRRGYNKRAIADAKNLIAGWPITRAA